MAIFSTYLPVSRGFTSEMFSTLPDQDSNKISFMDYDSGNISAFRLSTKDAIWDCVVNFDNRKMRIYGTDSACPFVKKLFQADCLEKDGKFSIRTTPHILTRSMSGLMQHLSEGLGTYMLPIVYIPFQKKAGIDAKKLSEKLSLLAHVITPDSFETSMRFYDRSQKKTAQMGSVDIYFLPDRGKRYKKRIYASRYGKNAYLMEDAIVRAVMEWHISQKVDVLYTVAGISSANLASQADMLKNALAGEVQKANKAVAEKEVSIKEKDDALQLAGMYEEENSALLQKTGEHENRIAMLEAENAGLAAKIEGSLQIPVLVMGSEKDFYAGEVKDIVLSSLKEARKSAREHSRRADILDDIISANSYIGSSEKKAKRIKTLMKGFKTMDKSTRQELESMGLKISQGRTHYKIKYFDDDRYSATISLTSSDKRSGDNVAHDIINVMF